MPFGRMDADLWSVGAACFYQKRTPVELLGAVVPDPVQCAALTLLTDWPFYRRLDAAASESSGFREDSSTWCIQCCF